MAVAVGGLIALVGLLLMSLLVVEKIFITDFQPGYTSTVAIIVFFGGVQILVIGVASLYIGRILKEVQNRPLYVVKERINFESAPSSARRPAKEKVQAPSLRA
jgi:dolichol-phosphate mannosyltransferase